MSRISYYLKKARSMPLDELAVKIANKILNTTKNKFQKTCDLIGNTHIQSFKLFNNKIKVYKYKRA